MSDQSMAICFRCAAAKPRGLDVCTSCGSGPRTNREYLLSAALSTHLSSEDELARYRDEILAGSPPSIPHEVLLRAIEALRDPAALAVLRSLPLGVAQATAPDPAESAPRIPPATSPSSPPLDPLAVAVQAIEDEVAGQDLAARIRDIGNLAKHLGSPDHPDPELARRRRQILETIHKALDRLPSATLVQVMTDTAEGATAAGTRKAPGLIEELIDRYEAEAAAGFLPTEATSIGRLIDDAKVAAASRQDQLEPHIAALDVVVQNWNRIARPIQINARARGMEHGDSRQLANGLRSLGIHLFDKHGLLAPALRIMDLLQRQFTAIPGIPERAARDRIALEGLSRRG